MDKFQRTYNIESKSINFNNLTKRELVALCERYRATLESYIIKPYRTRRLDVDSKDILDDFLAGMNWNQLKNKYELDVKSIKLRIQRELSDMTMEEVKQLKEEIAIANSSKD